MSILNLENISKAFGEKVILDCVSAAIEEGQRIGVVGINGAGKSTLLSVVAGLTEPDSGTVVKRRDLRISYLPQAPVFDPKLSIGENVIQRIYGKAGHWDTKGEAFSLLAKFGITDPEVLPGLLSGGQRKRAALIAALLTPSDLLILDEPTNHLDMEMIAWLQEQLSQRKQALLMVTHDRYFLDEVTTHIWELDQAKLYSYDANYSGYLEAKQERLDFQKAAERKMAALYKQDLKWMLRGARARSTKQKAHIARFEALRDREKIMEERSAVIASMPSRLGRTIIEVEDLKKAFGDKLLFHDFTYAFTRNDRIGIIGKNGCGKSTLIRMLMGLEKPTHGKLSIGQTVKFGYFSQENEALCETDRVIDCVRNVAEYVDTPDGMVSASTMCDRFLFPPNMQYTPVSKLSGGEKRRLYLLKVLMGSPNVLILDEPTNDLDIQTLQVLEDYLDSFNGVIIAVSHDRYFLDRVVTRIFSFEEDKQLHQSEGAWSEYLMHREEMQQAAAESAGGSREKFSSASGAERAAVLTGDHVGAEIKTLQRSAGSSDAQSGKTARTAHSAKKLSYSEQREYDGLEKKIDELTAKEKELDEAMLVAASDYPELTRLTKEKEQVASELEAKIERYLELEEKIN